MKIHRQLTATAFLFISMAIMAQVPFSKKEVKEKMKQVADWQISNPNTAHEHHDLKESGHTEESASLCILVAPDHIPDLF